MLDTVTGFDMGKVEELVNMALLVEQTSHDESIMVRVLQESQKLIEEKKYA